MTCDQVKAGEITERYVRQQLSETERDEFELHFFTCSTCLDEVQTYQALQGELALKPKTRAKSATWMLIAAALIAVAGLAWMLTKSRPEQQQAASQPPPAVAQPSAPAQPPAESKLDLLARVSAPRYREAVLRGSASDAFQSGMKLYAAGEYTAAIQQLESSLSGARPEEALMARFFLGISHLMASQTDPAIRRLREAIDAGDSPYLEQARFFLAKAYIRARRYDDAERELNRAAALKADMEQSARRLLDDLRASRDSLPRL